MAYNYFPTYFSSPYLQVPAPQQAQSQAASQLASVRSSDFVIVRSEDEARNYPVAFGTTVTFKNETMPYIYTKTMGNSQLDLPTFEKYKLVKETPQDAPQDAKAANNDNGIIKKMEDEIEAIWREIEGMKKKPNTKRVLEDDGV